METNKYSSFLAVYALYPLQAEQTSGSIVMSLYRSFLLTFNIQLLRASYKERPYIQMLKFVQGSYEVVINLKDFYIIHELLQYLYGWVQFTKSCTFDNCKIADWRAVNKKAVSADM